ncbi:MAG: O-methyltransferase, partial [Bacteroidota bacterium]
NVEEDFMKPSENEENKITLKEYRLNELNNRIGKERLPNEFKELNMTTKNLSMVVYEMIRRQIITSLKNRNGNSKDKVSFNQVFNFTYKDNATILTVGGIVFNKAQNVAVKKMTFNKFTFFSNTHESYKIQSPNLTFREIKALDKALPDSLETVNGKFQNKKLQNIPLIPTDIKNYAKVYRYYPNFTEANI